jgi:hypothetical protein
MRSGFRRLAAVWRGRVARRQFLLVRQAAVKLQSWYRMQQCLTEYRKTLKAVLILQRGYRARLASRAGRTQFLKKRLAAITIQVPVPPPVMCFLLFEEIFSFVNRNVRLLPFSGLNSSQLPSNHLISSRRIISSRQQTIFVRL